MKKAIDISLEEQRVVIAKACGTYGDGYRYNFHYEIPGACIGRYSDGFLSREDAIKEKNRLEGQGFKTEEILVWHTTAHDLPDYPESLEAIGKAMDSLDETDRQVFMCELEFAVRCNVGNAAWERAEPHERLYWLVNATSRQRSRAFCDTISKREAKV